MQGRPRTGYTAITECRSVPRRTFPLSKVYGLLEPGPVVLLTTADKGRANVMTQSWHTMLDFEPPLVACVVSNRNFTFNDAEGDQGVRDQHPDR